MTENINNWKLLSDTPVDAMDHEDKLKFDSVAEVLGRSAAETHDPITIGVFGKWGTGKTKSTRYYSIVE